MSYVQVCMNPIVGQAKVQETWKPFQVANRIAFGLELHWKRHVTSNASVFVLHMCPLLAQKVLWQGFWVQGVLM